MASPLTASLSLFLFNIHIYIYLSADNMLDQTKVETSEAKANELEKKVKDSEKI